MYNKGLYRDIMCTWIDLTCIKFERISLYEIYTHDVYVCSTDCRKAVDKL